MRPEIAQQLHAAALDPLTMLSQEAVCALCGMSKTMIYKLVRDAGFPAPIKMGVRWTRWRAGEVRAWLTEQRAGQKTVTTPDTLPTIAPPAPAAAAANDADAAPVKAPAKARAGKVKP